MMEIVRRTNSFGIFRHGADRSNPVEQNQAVLEEERSEGLPKVPMPSRSQGASPPLEQRGGNAGAN